MLGSLIFIETDVLFVICNIVPFKNIIIGDGRNLLPPIHLSIVMQFFNLMKAYCVMFDKEGEFQLNFTYKT